MRSLKHFYRIAFLVFFLLTGTITAVRGGSGVGTLRLSQLLTNPDGSSCSMPCVLGVHPGHMTLSQAKTVLRMHPLVQPLDESNCSLYIGWCAFRLRGFDASGMIGSTVDGTIQNIYILLDDPHTLRLGDFVDTLGTPHAMVPRFSCCEVDKFISQLTRFPPPYGFRFYFPDQGVLVRDNAEVENGTYRLRPDSPVIDFLVTEPSVMKDLVSQRERNINAWDEWHGFTSVNRYFDLALAAK